MLLSFGLAPRNGVTVGVEFGGAAVLETDSEAVPIELGSPAVPLEKGSVIGDMLTVVVVVVGVSSGVAGADVATPALLDTPASMLLGAPGVEVETPAVIASAEELAVGGGGRASVETGWLLPAGG